MPEENSDALVQNLNKILDKERAALAAGDIHAISHFLDQKERLIESLRSCDAHDRDALAKVQQKMNINHNLAAGALDGIRYVTARITAIRRARSCLQIYDRSGIKTLYSKQAPTEVEKRS